jgi:apolipoprotein D and lipocalin family protein
MAIIGLAGLLSAGSGRSLAEGAPPVPVPQVDLDRYAGRWYEIAKIPNWFQRSCVGGTTADYAVRPDGMIDVVNRCLQKDGTAKEARGVARVENEKTRSELKVSFVRFLWRRWFWGDYWIIGLDPDYQYAVVGTPDRKYGWILARRPKLDPSQFSAVNRILEQQGYDPADFEMTRQ